MKKKKKGGGKLPTTTEIYRGIRKPVPPPERVEPDRRETLKERENDKEMSRHLGRDGEADGE